MITFFPEKLIDHFMLSKNKIVQTKLRNMVKLNKYQRKVVFRLDLDKIQYTIKLVWKRLAKKKQGYIFYLFQKIVCAF